MVILLPLLLGLSLGCVGVGGFVAHVESTCLLDNDGNPQDFTYCVSFNKDLLACWDPEQGKIAPCEFGVLYNLAELISNYLNKDEQLLQRLGKGLQDCAVHTKPFWNALTHRTSTIDQFEYDGCDNCEAYLQMKGNREMVYDCTSSSFDAIITMMSTEDSWVSKWQRVSNFKPGPPSVQVAQTAPVNTREPVMLACYVWGFYPADVSIVWMKNGHVVMPHNDRERTAQTNGDWTYQTVSHLALTPSYGDIYTCVVQHEGTSEPVRQDWTVGLSPIQTVKVSVSATTLGLGFIIFCFGFYSWRKSRFSSYIPLPGSTYPEGRH